jgi:NAD(P)-dependent dehydrogenase (short-subunit alcohol dehydrogenase family)
VASSDLNEKFAVVTGASSGIGAAVAVTLAEAGANVALCGRDRRRIATMAKQVETLGRRAVPVIVDLAEPGEIRSVPSQLGETSQVDVLVHCAGILETGRIEETSIESLERTWQINVRAPFLLTQALMPLLGVGSSIVFVSSVAGRVGINREATYSMSKAAVDGLTRALSVELSHRGIRVNCVSPGFIATPMNAEFRKDRETVGIVEQSSLAGRLGTPKDIANAVLFLSSPAAAYVYGHILSVDGGYPTAPVVLNRDWHAVTKGGSDG